MDSDTQDIDGWRLSWFEEFDQDGRPDPSKWSYEEGYIRNNEAQYYTVDRPENARVEGGMLVIEARKDWYDGTGTAGWPCFEDQYLILNLAIGGSWGGLQGIVDEIFPVTYLVDYVRIYQR